MFNLNSIFIIVTLNQALKFFALRPQFSKTMNHLMDKVVEELINDTKYGSSNYIHVSCNYFFLEGFVLRLPTFMFLTAFSQITSRICHPLDECFKTLTDIIVKCILDYPNHSLWMLMTLHKVLLFNFNLTSLLSTII